MPRARDILRAARAATVWMLMLVSMFLGPASASAAGPDACGDACPCEAERGDHDDADDCGDGWLADEHERGRGTPSDTGCPEDCPGCHASPVVVLTSFVCTLPRAPPASSAHAGVPGDACAAGICAGVFRPPRAP